MRVECPPQRLIKIASNAVTGSSGSSSSAASSAYSASIRVMRHGDIDGRVLGQGEARALVVEARGLSRALSSSPATALLIFGKPDLVVWGYLVALASLGIASVPLFRLTWHSRFDRPRPERRGLR